MSLSYGLLNYSDMTGYELAKAFNDSLRFFWRAHCKMVMEWAESCIRRLEESQQ